MIFKGIHLIVNLFKIQIEKHIWQSRKEQNLALQIFTYPLSLLYENILNIRRFAYKYKLISTHKLPGITISIGNLVVGGSGKSPTAIWLAQELQKKGLNIVVLSRGYGSKIQKKEYLWFSQGKIKRARNRLKLNCDEPLMISEQAKTNVVVGINRKKAAEWFCSFHKTPDIWILDDGFQHLKLEQDLRFVLIDGEQEFGNKQLLPSGPLREPLTALKRATHLFMSRANNFETTTWNDQNITPICSDIEIKPYQLTHLDKNFKNPLIASGIARPERFLNQVLDKEKFQKYRSYFVADHSRFDKHFLIETSSQHSCVITTWKDFYRDKSCFQQLNAPLYIADLIWEVSPQKKDGIISEIIKHTTHH